MKILAVIHARGGSKRIPLKNIAKIGDKPLIFFCIHALKGSQYPIRINVSTDHPDIKKAAEECGAELPFVRPADISEDVPSEMVTLHSYNYYKDNLNFDADIVITIQPTTPFITAEAVNKAVKAVIDGADSAVTMEKVDKHPYWMFKKNENGYAENLMGLDIKGDLGVIQQLPEFFIPNGGVYVTRKEFLLNNEILMGGNMKIIEMSPERSVDIDVPIDLEVARVLYDKMFKKDYE